MKMPSDAPKVTGLSPKEGPPGTKITIRGENLGLSQQDLVGLMICGVDCLMYAEWKSPSKIITRTGVCSGPGDVVVTTCSGGRGTSTVKFNGFFEPIGPTKESAVWVDESRMVISPFGRNRPTSPSQLHPDDPLGLSDEASMVPFPEAQLREAFPEGSGNLLSQNFIPAWYLLENHHKTSFTDLKAGLSCLQRKIKDPRGGPSSFLKSNVMAIVECLDVLGALQSSLQKDKQEMGSDLTEKLEEAVNKSKLEADTLFESVLQRKEKADATRNALSVLQRYRFLFNLPASIEKNIQQGDYDVVINDYARAKSLFQHTEVPVFKKVYQEVEQRIQQFRDMLAKKLKTLPSTVDEQKQLIGYLINLESPGDPAWESICHMHSWLLNAMNACKTEHLALAQDQEAAKGDIGPQGDSLGSPVSQTPQVVLFLEEMLQLYSDRFPDLWKLGLAYLHGDLHAKEDMDRFQKVDRETAFEDMVLGVTRQLCKSVRAALLPEPLHGTTFFQRDISGNWPRSQLSDSMGFWLPHCLRYIRQCFFSLLKLSPSASIIHLFQQLIFDLRVHAMTRLFVQATEDVKNLHQREAWVTEMDDQNGGTTRLPLMFESRVVETLQLVRETIVHTGSEELEVFSQINVQATIKQLSQALLQAFVHALDTLAFSLEIDNSPVMSLNSGLSISYIPGDASLHQSQEDEKLLIVLSNCSYTTRMIIPSLQDNFQKLGYPDMTLVIKGVVLKFKELEKKLFDAYIERKCDPVVGAIEPCMYSGGFDWSNCLRPTGVSMYIKETLMNMISVHAEVFSVSPPFVGQVMTRVVEAVVEELARLYECSGRFTGNGNIQASLDLRAVDEALLGYRTNNTSKYFMICRGHLEPFADLKDKELVEDLLKKFRNHMRIQLLCFKEEAAISV